MKHCLMFQIKWIKKAPCYRFQHATCICGSFLFQYSHLPRITLILSQLIEPECILQLRIGIRIEFFTIFCEILIKCELLMSND